MPTITLTVREAGKVLGETGISIPELAYVPEAAAYLVDERGAETPLLGWGSRLWAPVRHPDSGDRLDLAAFTALLGTPRDANPFAAPAFDNPFEPNRFLHPLAVSARSDKAQVLAARLDEVRAAAADLTVIAGAVHRRVFEPVHHLVAAGAGFALTVRFDPPGIAGAAGGLDAFRADRGDDAEAYARIVAERAGKAYLGRRRDLRVIYDAILARDDVHAAFVDAFGRFERIAAAPVSAPGEAELAVQARDLVLSKDRFAEPAEEAEAAHALAGRMLESLRPTIRGDMARQVTLDVLELLSLRYERLDRPHLAAPTPVLGA